MKINKQTYIFISVIFGVSLLILLFLSVKRAPIPVISIFAPNRSPLLKIYRRNPDNSSNPWKLDPTLCPKVSNIRRAELNTPAGNVPLYIYDEKEDNFVSKDVQTKGSFQPEVSRVLYKLISREKNAQFLDLGGNIGVIALSIAKGGFPVIAVEPFYLNLIRLCNSVKVANLTDKVTILNTALSNKRKYVKLRLYAGNKGGTQVFDDKKDNTAILFNGTVMSSTLDDILTLPGFQNRKTFIKMDIQGYEYKALEMGKKFFDVVDVRGVLVEWVMFRGKEDGKKIIKFFRDRFFIPLNYATAEVLAEKTSDSWPYDVLWSSKRKDLETIKS